MAILQGHWPSELYVYNQSAISQETGIKRVVVTQVNLLSVQFATCATITGAAAKASKKTSSNIMALRSGGIEGGI